jgi:serpin B
MRASSLSSASLLALSLTACSSLTKGPGSVEPPAPHGSAPIAPTAPPATAPAKPAAPPSDPSYAASTNALGYDLYRKLGATPGNLAFSPASIETALSMAWAGAKGDTELQMQHVLHFGGDRQEALGGARETLAWLTGAHDGYELAVADELFGDRAYPFDPGFLSLEKTTFGAPLETVDFAHAFEAARADVNGFVAGVTKGKIPVILGPGSVDEATRLVLVNAIYMHAKWQSAFDAKATRPAPFFAAGGAHDVPTMHQGATLPFADAGDALVLELPYQGGDLAMTVILPKDRDGIGALEQKLGPGAVEAYVKALSPARVDVSLPRFEVASPEPIALKPALSALGMPLAFDDARADFTAMSKPGGERLHVDDVYHRAFVDVNEEGTTAAAATAVVMSRETTAVEPRPVDFVADHPFLFAIRDVHTGMLLFVGRVANPTA